MDGPCAAAKFGSDSSAFLRKASITPTCPRSLGITWDAGSQTRAAPTRGLATRIQARAVRRSGDLLKEIFPAKNHHDAKSKSAYPAGQVSRSQAAREAGLSKFQKDLAIAIASIPEADFEAAVESDDPPTW